MSDGEHNNTQGHVEPKAEDNAPINIKVRLAVAPRVTVSDALLPFISLEHIVLSAASV